ncbi:MAG: septum formation initiator family protein [Myxococcales bacterium]|nr:septum formation initiator family protein [Myxococcales bacterium]
MHDLRQSTAWLLPFGLLVLSVVAVPLLILDDEGLPRYRVLKEELIEVEAGNEVLRQEVQRLKGQAESLRRDPAAIERIARDELGMVRKDELVFQF